MRLTDATLAQNRASEPDLSTWLSANAGSGKTKVLTDRVARLLLRGVAPVRILCLTYTKAAASEMQNRLFKLLGQWAMMPDAALHKALSAIGEDADAATLPEARRLFARAIETPGGLKIQTIHSFCGALLRRFPLEAGLSPAFVELDDRAALILREDVLNQIAEGPGRAALQGLAELVGEASVAGLVADLSRHAAGFAGPVPEDALRTAFDLPAGLDVAALLAQVFLGDEAATRARIMPALQAGSQRDTELAAKLAALDLDAPNLDTLIALEGALLTGKGANDPFTAKIGALPTKPTRIALGDAVTPLEALMRRVETARPLRLGLAALERALAVHRFARHFLPAYAAAKAARGALDFDDLIARTGALLTDPSVAQWVLFKLDGGVDHILVDEAQDTSPGQWRVIENLTQEFTAGQGARDTTRTLFVVGDKKQSIYSFQGADLAAFDAMQAQFRTRLAAVGLRLNEAALEHSFRSSDAVLRVVDQSFPPDQAEGLGGPPRHLAFQAAMPGRVDIWPLVDPAAKRDDIPWFAPLDQVSEAHHTRVLARAIAAELRRLIDARTPILHKGQVRALTEGDVLILLRTRGGLFHEIIAACKACGLRMAGADRLRLGGEMAVRDLTAMLAFLDMPEDDLSLAALLRSPLFGWSEDALYRLAQGRAQGEFLWTRLRARSDEPALAILNDLRAQADFLRPFDLVDRMLTRHDGRRKLLARLGEEAEEGIDAFLSLALSYESQDVPSLGGFLDWLARDEVDIKRQADSGGDTLRVMTVHGAKGLEAPLVILPDTADAQSRERGQVVTLAAGLVAAATPKDDAPPALRAALDRREHLRALEAARLLYVAMTRAESWLIVAGAGKPAKPDAWHRLAQQGVQAAGAIPFDTPTGPGLRHQHQDWPELADHAPADPHMPPELPAYLDQPAPAPALALKPLSPSGLGGPKAMPGEVSGPEDRDLALVRGHALHLLLEHLPHWSPDEWSTRAPDLLDDIAAPTEIADILTEARAVLANPDLTPFFSPDALAEVEITATLAGQPLQGVIDRLLVRETEVLALDYKSNRLVPDSPADIPEGLLRQMAAYRAALAQVFVGREIRVALVWTRAGGQVMWLPDDLLHAALARALLENIPQGA
ncbi:MAG: double-strand break repair helicase AddA [Roseinatronobacter sp.]